MWAWKTANAVTNLLEFTVNTSLLYLDSVSEWLGWCFPWPGCLVEAHLSLAGLVLALTFLSESLPGLPMFPLLLLNCFSSIFPHALYPSYFHIYPKFRSAVCGVRLYLVRPDIVYSSCSFLRIWAVSGYWGQEKHFLHSLAPIDKTAAVITESPEEDIIRNGGVLPHTYDTHVWKCIVKPFMCNMLLKTYNSKCFTILAKSGQWLKHTNWLVHSMSWERPATKKRSAVWLKSEETNLEKQRGLDKHACCVSMRTQVQILTHVEAGCVVAHL